jgi:multiple sugar transport system substrate-binding protein
MSDFVGLTWDHPRGRVALETAAAAFSETGPDRLTWDHQPLEGFESTPIAELAERYDLIVLDHPHLGDALAGDCIRPLDELFPSTRLVEWRRAAVGPSFDSYAARGQAWALPLDAATQVSARRPSEVADAPREWSDALELARSGGVAPSLAGPHAFLTLCSIAVSLGGDPGAHDDFLPGAIFDEALEVLSELAALAPPGSDELNPIGLLDRMSEAGDIRYIPLVYGYAPYARRPGSRRIAFGSPPAHDGRIGATLGGTGIAISRRCEPSEDLLAHLEWLMSETVQREFIPQHDGQPGARAAWLDPAVDAAAHGFYSQTLEAIERSWVRPRFAGYIPAQSLSSALVREALHDAGAARIARERIAETLRSARAAGRRTPAPVEGARS